MKTKLPALNPFRSSIIRVELDTPPPPSGFYRVMQTARLTGVVNPPGKKTIRYYGELNREAMNGTPDKFNIIFRQGHPPTNKNDVLSRENFEWHPALPHNAETRAWVGHGCIDRPADPDYAYVFEGHSLGYNYEGFVEAGRPKHFSGEYRLQRGLKPSEELLHAGSFSWNFYPNDELLSLGEIKERVELRIRGEKGEHLLSGIVTHFSDVHGEMSALEHAAEHVRIGNLFLQRLLASHMRLKQLVSEKVLSPEFIGKGRSFALAGLAAGLGYLYFKANGETG